jgi:hypothetical protein
MEELACPEEQDYFWFPPVSVLKHAKRPERATEDGPPVRQVRKMMSHADFERERRLQPVARLEIHSARRSPSRAEITSARLVKGRFTLSLQSSPRDHVHPVLYVTQIVPVDALRWFSENCESFRQEESSSGVSATVNWEELRQHLSK